MSDQFDETGEEPDEIIDIEDDAVSYTDPENITVYALQDGLNHLTLFSKDPNFTIQAFNLAAVDQFIMDLETDTLQKLIEYERTPIQEATFLSAQSQLWIFGMYELLRTWRQRALEIIKWHENGGLELKIKEYEKDVGYRHFGRQLRAKVLKDVLAKPSIVDDLKADLRKTHIAFSRLEAVRVSMAKHEVRGKKNSVAFMPTYGRINGWCGSLDYELSNDAYIMGYINRRDIADEIRNFVNLDPPTDEEIKQFDDFMRGPIQTSE